MLLGLQAGYGHSRSMREVKLIEEHASRLSNHAAFKDCMLPYTMRQGMELKCVRRGPRTARQGRVF